MVFLGETLGTLKHKCQDCGFIMLIQVLHSQAGYYIGFFCDNCGPYSRESDYYSTNVEAQDALNNKTYGRI